MPGGVPCASAARARLPIKRRATFSPRRARTRGQRLVPLLLYLPLPRIIHYHLLRRSCARARRVCRLELRRAPVLRRGRLGASVAGLRHCAPDSAQCRFAPAPAPAPTCAHGAACLARTFLPPCSTALSILQPLLLRRSCTATDSPRVCCISNEHLPAWTPDFAPVGVWAAARAVPAL